MRKIAAAMGLTLAALAGPGLTATAPAVAAAAVRSGPGLAGSARPSASPGARLWARRYAGPGNGDDLASSVAVSPSGSTVFITGYTFGATQEYTTIAYNAATGATLWTRHYSGPGDSQASKVAVSPSGGTVFVTGWSTGATSGKDYATVAYNAATGATLWAQRYNGPGNGDDFATALAVSPAGDVVYVTGSSTSATPGADYATVAYNAATGATLWVSRYHGLMYGLDGAASVAVSPSGGTVFVTGASIGTTAYDYATVADNAATGAQVWVSRYNGDSAQNGGLAAAVAVSPSGNTVFVTGNSTGASSNDDYATVAYNAATGAQLWVSRYNGPGNFIDDAASVAVSPSGGTVYVTGRSYGTSVTHFDYATIAYNAATGATQWLKRYNGPGNGDDAASSLALSPGGGTVYVTGYSYGGPTTGYDYATIAYNAATGAPLWARRYNGPANSTDAAYAVAVSPSTGAVYATGISYGSNGNGDYLTVAYSG